MNITSANNSLIYGKNKFYTASNIISTIAFFVLKEVASLHLTTFTCLGIVTIIANYFIFDVIATSSLSNKEKFIPLQVALLGLIILGSVSFNVFLLSSGVSLSTAIYGLLVEGTKFSIADLPIYMLILSIALSFQQTLKSLISVFRKNIVGYNKLLQEFRPFHWIPSERPLIRVSSMEAVQFILFLITEAITRENRGGNSNQMVFDHNNMLASYLIVHVDDNSEPKLNPSRFIEISECLQSLPEELDFQEDREITFRTLLYEFQRLSIPLQEQYFSKILQHQYLYRHVPSDLKRILREYQIRSTTPVSNIDELMTANASLQQKILQFTGKSSPLRRIEELKHIMTNYTSMQNSLRENLSREVEDTSHRRRLVAMINSLYSLYEKKIVPIRFQFPDDSSNDDMNQPTWNYLVTKFPQGFLQKLPSYLFSSIEDADKLEADFRKYKIGTAQEFITKVFNGDAAAFKAIPKQQILDKLIQYCTDNFISNRYKIQFLKTRDQAYKILRLSTSVFTTIIAPLLVHPIEFGVGSLYATIFRVPASPLTIETLSKSCLRGFFLSYSSFGSSWAGCSFGARYIVPLLRSN